MANVKLNGNEYKDIEQVTLPLSDGSGVAVFKRYDGKTVEEKDVNFFDYDGTLLYSYTLEEAQALTALPPLPEQPGLICQEWNWSLDDLKAHGAKMDVGATYITDDGATRLYLNIPLTGRLTVPLYFNQSVANGVTIDWGDGTAKQTVPGTGNVSTSHSYTKEGRYKITLMPSENCTIALGHGTTTEKVLGDNSAQKLYIYRLEIGKNCPVLKAYSFHTYGFETVTIPYGVTTNGTQIFAYCYNLKALIMPKSMALLTLAAAPTFCINATALGVLSIPFGTTVLPAYFGYGLKLKRVLSPNSITTYGQHCFAECMTMVDFNISTQAVSLGQNCFTLHKTTYVKVPPTVTELQAGCFSHNNSVVVYDFTEHTAVPTMANVDVFAGCLEGFEVRVPSSLRDEWAAETNWATYASQIVGV